MPGFFALHRIDVHIIMDAGEKTVKSKSLACKNRITNDFGHPREKNETFFAPACFTQQRNLALMAPEALRVISGTPRLNF
jgi:hypothetical protein